MQIFDIKKMKSYPYAEREKNVFYKTSSFKVRIIELPPNGEMPSCKMDSYVMFYILKGEVDIDINQEKKDYYRRTVFYYRTSNTLNENKKWCENSRCTNYATINIV